MLPPTPPSGPPPGSTTAPSPEAPSGPSSSGVTPGALLGEARADLRPVLLGLAAAFGAAVVLTLLMLLALVVSGTEPVDDGDASGAGVLLFLPFQVLGMGLLGTMGLSFEGLSGSLYAPVYWVSGSYVAVTALLARRAERQAARPTTTLERVRSGALLGVALGVVLLVLMRVLAMRVDGSVAHTASPSLFLGALLLTLGALWGGRWSARPRWHPALDLDLVVGLRLMWSVLLGWLVVGVPLAALLALVGEGVDAAVVLLVGAPTVAVYLVELAHLGALSAGGEHLFLFSENVGLAVVLTLAALVSTLLVSVAWHRRRVRPAGADAWSWAVLPLAGLVGGLVLWVAGVLVIGGGIAEFSGQVVLAPAFWSMFVLAAWALLAEGLSRTVAPALSPRLPERVGRLLDRPRPLHAGEQTAVATDGDRPAPRPRTPEEQRRDRRLVLAGAGVVGVLALLAIGYRVVDSTFFGPEDRVEAYLDAVVAGDLDEAQDLAPFDFEPEGLAFSIGFGDDAATDLFTREVYEAAEERVTGYEIVSTDVSGDTAEVEVRLEGLSGEPTADLTLYRDGRRWGVFGDWVVGEAGLAGIGSIYEESATLTVNGVQVDVEPGADQWLLPGSYDVDPYADNPFLELDGEPTVVEPGGYASIASVSTPQPTQEFRDQLQEQVDAYLDECMASTELEPEGCPQSAFSFGDDPRNVEWTLDQAPDLGEIYLSGEFPETLYLSDGEATATFEADESYGFGRPDYQPQEDTSYLAFQVEVDVDGDDLVVTFEP
ncbi:hypothetical protein BKA08_001995 [Nocardioides marinisabuli]|uniref:Uncharacterized protein n=1 Tax=Nocardioides marinisabuli TaxID=419476 RepID=A0A7Y9JQ77_9ACTN|nr:hypothetical protein [Nocardioides marinisabuli]NYD57757.1 hypothetical protein [Nocardioides marinisabuli]